MKTIAVREKLPSILANAIRAPIRSIQELPPGANSRIFKMSSKKRAVCCVKYYLSRPGDRRDRLGTEFGAFSFLWNHGVRVIPKPIAQDKKNTIGIYSYVSGKTLRSITISNKELIQSVDFLETLHSLRTKEGSKNFSPASEASLSLGELVENIKNREKKLQNVSRKYKNVENFLRAWQPVWERATRLIPVAAKKAGFSLSDRLPKQHQTLSPSDFGFHNAIRSDDGTLTFVDFEYFGWDDPAKLISDFLLHPGMKLTKRQKQWFLKRTLSIYKNDPTLAKRLPLVYVLLGLKWSLIMLNCFLDGGGAAPSRDTARRQLIKARRNLITIKKALHSPTLSSVST